MGTCVPCHICEVRSQSSSPLTQHGSWYLTQVVRLGRRHPYLWRHVIMLVLPLPFTREHCSQPLCSSKVCCRARTWSIEPMVSFGLTAYSHMVTSLDIWYPQPGMHPTRTELITLCSEVPKDFILALKSKMKPLLILSLLAVCLPVSSSANNSSAPQHVALPGMEKHEAQHGWILALTEPGRRMNQTLLKNGF